MNSRIFIVDFNKLVQWLVPPVLRQAKTIAWLLALVKPVTTVYQVFLRYRTQKLYELMITPQVCYLERLLNDKYDFVLRRIQIVDAIDHAPTYLFTRAELKPVYFRKRSETAPVYFFTRGETGAIKDDFVILVPAAIVFDSNEMSTLVKAFKLAATRFKIQII